MKQNQVFSLTGTHWSDLFDITLNVDSLRGGVLSGEGTDKFEGDYISSDAITLTDYANLPIYSKIWDFQASVTHIKTAAAGTSTWATLTWT